MVLSGSCRQCGTRVQRVVRSIFAAQGHLGAPAPEVHAGERAMLELRAVLPAVLPPTFSGAALRYSYTAGVRIVLRQLGGPQTAAAHAQQDPAANATSTIALKEHVIITLPQDALAQCAPGATADASDSSSKMAPTDSAAEPSIPFQMPEWPLAADMTIQACCHRIHLLECLPCKRLRSTRRDFNAAAPTKDPGSCTVAPAAMPPNALHQ